MTEIEALRCAVAALAPESEERAILSEMIRTREETEARLARPYTHRVVGWRNYRPASVDVQSLEEAIGYAYWAVEDNTMFPEKIETMEGEIVLSGSDLDKARSAHGRALTEEG